MKDKITRFSKLLNDTPPKLRLITESESKYKPSPDKWSKKEILGHLIDSASNNHQRIVRAQLENLLYFPAYQQMNWVNVQNYRDEPWDQIIIFWESYNLHLLYILTQIPDDKWNNLCTIGTNKPITLSVLANDYLDHLMHHLQQIFS